MTPPPDGYTQCLTNEYMTILYRPLTHSLRRQLLTTIQSVPPVYGMTLFADAVSQRIISWDWPEKPSSDLIRNMKEWNPSLFESVTRTMLGVGTAHTEQQNAANLAHGVRLELLYPATARLSCQDCQAYWVDPITGEYTYSGGCKLERIGPLLCQTKDGCPAGTPGAQRRLSAQNKLAYEHYRECAATNSFPDDCWVRKNAKIIKSAIDRVEAECRRARVRNDG